MDLDTITTVRTLVGATAHLQQSGPGGGTALHAAVLEGQPTMCRLLMRALAAAHREAEVDTPDRVGRTALALAAGLNAASSPAVVALLLEAGASVRARDAAGRTPLHAAAAAGNVRALQLLLAAGAPVDAPAADGSTPLAAAAGEGYTAAVSVLLSYGASPAAVDARGASPAAALLARSRAGLVDAVRAGQTLELLRRAAPVAADAAAAAAAGAATAVTVASTATATTPAAVGEAGAPIAMGTYSG